jgi:RNA polymerase sigma factor (sigma-70 family)
MARPWAHLAATARTRRPAGVGPWSNEANHMEPAGAGDRELMARLAAGDGEALAPLMERHYRRLYRIALSYLRHPDDALDVVQEAFVKVFQSASRWDGSAEAGPWLARIAVNLSIDRWRRNRRRAQTFTPLGESDHAASLADLGPSPDQRLQGREAGERVTAALLGLPERQRAVVVLRHYQGMTLEEIAGALDMSLGTVKSSLHRALSRMRAALAGGEA